MKRMGQMTGWEEEVQREKVKMKKGVTGNGRGWGKIEA